MDSFLCHHRTPRCSAQGEGGVPDGGPLRQLQIGKDVGAESERPAGRGGPEGYPIGGPIPRRPLNVVVRKDGAMADCAAVNGKRDGTGCAGMAIFPLSAIWTRAPIPPSLLLRMQCQFLHIPCPRLQEGRPFYGVSQRAL